MRSSASTEPAAGSALPGRSTAHSGCEAAEDVERQEAVVAVVAVEEAALLAAVHRVVRRVDVEHQPGRGQPPRPGVDEQLGQKRLERLRVVGDPVVPLRLPVPGRVFEAVQRALARQRRAAPAPSLELARQQRQHRIVPQGVMVVEVLVSQGQPRDALRHQRVQGMLHKTRIAPVREAGGHPVEQTHGSVDLAQQQAARVGGDRPAIERGRHLPTPAPLKSERNGSTLCWHRSSVVVTVKCMRYINLTVPGGRCHLMSVRHPG